MKNLLLVVLLVTLFSGYQAFSIYTKTQNTPQYDYAEFSQSLAKIESQQALLEKSQKIVQALAMADKRANNWKQVAGNAWTFAAGVLLSLSVLLFRQKGQADAYETER